MTKERINISIKKELMKKVRMQIPNLSGFVEECLEHYFGYADGTSPIGNITEIADKIGKLQLQLFLLSEKQVNEEKIAEAEQEKIDHYWRSLYLKFRDELLSDDLMEEASEILEVDVEKLENIMFDIYAHHLFFNTWEEAKKWYGDKQ